MMKQIRTAQDISSLGTILSVWAHPDDETFSCAGIMTTAIANGQTVACITTTKGEAGVQDDSRWPAARLGQIRADEMKAAMHIIGCVNHNWLEYSDGHCDEIDDDEAVGSLQKIAELYSPDTILTFGPEGMTGHSDHQAVSRWVSKLANVLPKSPQVYHAVQLQDTYDMFLRSADETLDIFFNIDEPPLKLAEQCDIYFELSPHVCAIKNAALAAMPSQTTGMIEHFGEDVLSNVFSHETFVRASI